MYELKLNFPAEDIDLPQTLRAIEKDLIIMALRRSFGVKATAAKMLGLNRTTLIEKMIRFEMKMAGSHYINKGAI